MQLEQVVDQVPRGVAAPRGIVRRPDLLVQLLGPRPRPAEAASLQQAGRALPGDGGEQEVAHEDDEVVEVVAGRGAGGEDTQLVGGDALQRVVGGYRPVGRPRRDLAAHYLDQLGDVLLGRGPRVPPLHPVAHAVVLGAVHAHHRALRAQLRREVSPGLGAPQVVPPLLHEEHVGFGTGEDGDSALERAHPEDGSQPLVLARQVGADVAGEAEGVAGHRYPRRRGRRQVRHRPLDDRGDRVAGERLRAKLGDALPRALQLARRHDLLEAAAGIDQADEGDVARRGALAVRQHVREAGPQVVIGGGVEHRVAGGAQDPEPAVPLDGEDAAGHQPVEGRVEDLVRARRRSLYPGGDALPVGRSMDPREQRIEKTVSERCGIGGTKVPGTVSDAVGQGQIDQRGAGDGIMHGSSLRPRHAAGLAVEQQQAECFRAGRLGPSRDDVSTRVVLRHRRRRTATEYVARRGEGPLHVPAEATARRGAQPSAVADRAMIRL